MILCVDDARAGDGCCAKRNVWTLQMADTPGAYDGGVFSALERVDQHHRKDGRPPECFWRIPAERTILCARVLERPVAFRNNDRPGIMMAGPVRDIRLCRHSGDVRRLESLGASEVPLERTSRLARRNRGVRATRRGSAGDDIGSRFAAGTGSAGCVALTCTEQNCGVSVMKRVLCAMVLIGAAAPVLAANPEDCGYQSEVVKTVQEARLARVKEREVLAYVAKTAPTWPEAYNNVVPLVTPWIYEMKMGEIRKADLGAAWNEMCLKQ